VATFLSPPFPVLQKLEPSWSRFMTEELQLLRDIVSRLDAAGIAYILTGSVALNCYAQPRMTRDIDLVVAFYLKDAERIHEILGQDYTATHHNL
jgi:hypothetical protein